MSFEGNICEVSWFVRTKFALEHPLRLVVVHHVLLQENSCTEYFFADVAATFLNPMSVPHVVEQRSLGWTHLRAHMTVECFSLGLSNSVHISFMHSVADRRLEVFPTKLQENLMLEC